MLVAVDARFLHRADERCRELLAMSSRLITLSITLSILEHVTRREMSIHSNPFIHNM